MTTDAIKPNQLYLAESEDSVIKQEKISTNPATSVKACRATAEFVPKKPADLRMPVHAMALSPSLFSNLPGDCEDDKSTSLNRQLDSSKRKRGSYESEASSSSSSACQNSAQMSPQQLTSIYGKSFNTTDLQRSAPTRPLSSYVAKRPAVFDEKVELDLEIIYNYYQYLNYQETELVSELIGQDINAVKHWFLSRRSCDEQDGIKPPIPDDIDIDDINCDVRQKVLESIHLHTINMANASNEHPAFMPYLTSYYKSYQFSVQSSDDSEEQVLPNVSEKSPSTPGPSSQTTKHIPTSSEQPSQRKLYSLNGKSSHDRLDSSDSRAGHQDTKSHRTLHTNGQNNKICNSLNGQNHQVSENEPAAYKSSKTKRKVPLESERSHKMRRSPRLKKH